MKRIICRLLIGLVWCALIVSAQESPSDYYDYYDEPPVEEALAKDPLPITEDTAPKEPKVAEKEVPLEEAALTEAPTTTTTEPSTTKPSRRIVQIKPRLLSPRRRPSSSSQSSSNPKTEASATSAAKPRQESSSPRGSSTSVSTRRGSRNRVRGSPRETSTDTAPTEATEEESPSRRLTSRRNQRTRSQSSRTPSTSHSPSSRRTSGRSSISTTTEDTTVETGHRFRSGRRNLRGRQSSPPATDDKEEEPQVESTSPSRRRQIGRGNASRKLRFRPGFRSGPRFQQTSITRTTSDSPPVTDKTTTTTASSPVTEKITTTTEAIVTPIDSTLPPDVIETTTMEIASEPQVIEDTTLVIAPVLQESETINIANVPTLQETERNMEPAPAPQVTEFTTKHAPTPEVTEAEIRVPAPLSEVSTATAEVHGPSRATEFIPSGVATSKPALAVVTPKPIRILTTARPTSAAVPPKPVRIVAPAKPTPAVASPKSAQRGSSRYSPPKDPAHPNVQTTQAPSHIFAPPLSASVKSRARGSTPSPKILSTHDATHKPVTTAPVPKIETTTSKYPRPNYGSSDLRYVGGSVVITEVGTVEDTPPGEVRQILSGFGSRRRGLGRPQVKPTTKKATVAEPVFPKAPVESTVYDYYDDYYYDY